MINISDYMTPAHYIFNQYRLNPIEKLIIQKIDSSPEIYYYTSFVQLKFELTLRINIVYGAKALNKSRLKFKTFREAMCNPKYWILTDEGGFKLRDNVKPSDAIIDIFMNGYKYGTECSTAIVIVFYKAVLSTLGPTLFNEYFSNLYLMDWKYIDDDLGIRSYQNVHLYFPGDCRYFDNPDVTPRTPYWQGENVIDLGHDLYYGHGIGIKPADKMIHILNKFRKKDATVSAYLTHTAVRPNFQHLFNLYEGL